MNEVGDEGDKSFYHRNRRHTHGTSPVAIQFIGETIRSSDPIHWRDHQE